jgi:hypothetical protein
MTKNGYNQLWYNQSSVGKFQFDLEETFSGFSKRNSACFEDKFEEYKGGRDWFYLHYDFYDQYKNR